MSPGWPARGPRTASDSPTAHGIARTGSGRDLEPQPFQRGDAGVLILLIAAAGNADAADQLAVLNNG